MLLKCNPLVIKINIKKTDKESSMTFFLICMKKNTALRYKTQFMEVVSTYRFKLKSAVCLRID